MVSGLNHLTLAVQDLPTAFNFYKDVLGFKPLCRWSKGAYFLAGDLWFCLIEDPKASPGKGYTHFSFSVSLEDFPKMSQRLKEAGTPIWKENTSEGESLYFLDPDGYRLELHVGDWRTRLAYQKEKGGTDITFF